MVEIIHTAAYHTVMAQMSQTLPADSTTETPEPEAAAGTGQEYLSVEQIESSGTNQAEITLKPPPNQTMDIELEKSVMQTPSPAITISPTFTASSIPSITNTATHTRMPTHTLTSTATLWPSWTPTRTPTRTSTLKPSPNLYLNTHFYSLASPHRDAYQDAHSYVDSYGDDFNPFANTFDLHQQIPILPRLLVLRLRQPGQPISHAYTYGYSYTDEYGYQDGLPFTDNHPTTPTVDIQW